MKEKVIEQLQQEIAEKLNIHTDAYYTEGKGVLFVPMNRPLLFHNVVLAVSEPDLIVMALRKEREHAERSLNRAPVKAKC